MTVSYNTIRLADKHQSKHLLNSHLSNDDIDTNKPLFGLGPVNTHDDHPERRCFSGDKAV